MEERDAEACFTWYSFTDCLVSLSQGFFPCEMWASITQCVRALGDQILLWKTLGTGHV